MIVLKVWNLGLVSIVIFFFLYLGVLLLYFSFGSSWFYIMLFLELILCYVLLIISYELVYCVIGRCERL